MSDMNPLRRAIGLVLFMVGAVWFLLGVGLVQGSVVSNTWWATVIGAALVVVGVLVLQRKRPSPPNNR
jgi:LPXTG-motif cell wall-anchored protein